jgi:hypothetical protein
MRRSPSFLAPLALALAAFATGAACGPPPPPDGPADIPPAGASAEPTASSAPPAAPTASSAASAPRERNVAPNGDRAIREGTRVVILTAAGSQIVVEPGELHPPAGDRALLGITPSAFRYTDDGTLFVGLGDGTVTALDGEGRRRFSFGFRGAVESLVPAGPDLVAVTTTRGVMALVGSDGKLRWERQVTAEALGPAAVAKDGTVVAASQRGVFGVSATGELAFSHATPLAPWPCYRWNGSCGPAEGPTVTFEGNDVVVDKGPRFPLSGPHTPVASLVPTFPLTFRKVRSESVVSLLPDGEKALFALVTNRKERSDYDWGTDDRYDVVRIEGDKMTTAGVPETAARKEVFEKESRAWKAPLYIDGLVRGPTGDPWILARRISSERTTGMDGLMGRFGGAGQILELVGGKVRERSDLFKTFHDHWLAEPIAAAPEGTANLFCFGLESPTCAAYDGGQSRPLVSPGHIVRARRVGSALWLLDELGNVYRMSDDGKQILPAEHPAEAPIRQVAGVDEKDVWANHRKRYAALHLRGTTWEEVPVPVPVTSLTARAADDVWGGRMRWDGKAWSIVHNAPPATVVLARGKDDVWAGDAKGLWHGTAPGPVAVRLPAASVETSALPAATPIEVAADDRQYSAKQVTLELKGEKPLTAAKGAAASAEGVLWLTAWDRLVEVDAGGKATRLRAAGKDAFGRMAFPEGKGRGVFLERDEIRGRERRDQVRTLDGRAASTPDVQLDHHDAIAVHGDAGGSLWILGASPTFLPGSKFRYEAENLAEVGMSAWEEFSAHALVRPARGAALQPVLGLPAAAWCDVAATSDGGAWLAGAQSDGPAGEGVLFHAKGRLGAESTTRIRAAAALLAVSAAAPDDAWAVGAGGTVVHVKGGVVTRLSLRSGEWLRAVLAVGPEDVWIGGDGGTLVRWDGKVFHAVAHPLGTHAAFTGLAAAGGAVWAVGPSGILKLTKAAR